MTDVSLEVLNRRTAISAVRVEAARLGFDAEQLLDSARFYNQLGNLDPDEPGFAAHIRDMVSAAAGQQPAASAAVNQKPPEPRGQEPPRQWTLEDVKRSTPAETSAAIEAGLLVDLGVGSARKRR